MFRLLPTALLAGFFVVTPAVAQRAEPTTVTPESERASGGVVPTVKAAPGTTFDVSRFAKAMSVRLQPVVTSYAWTIMQGGKFEASDGHGFARAVTDRSRPHSPAIRQNIASVSKMITAVSVLQLLRAMDKNEDTKIAAYLPSGWAVGPNVSTLSFADLLNHRSGFSNANDNSEALLNFAAMRTMVAAGTTAAPPNPGRRPGDYRNVNFALLRVLLPQMFAQTGQSPVIFAKSIEDQLGKLPSANSATYQSAINNYFYTAWVQNRVFKPIGVFGTLCEDKSPKQTLYYDRFQTIKGEQSMGNNSWTNFCGSGGWYLSSGDLAQLISALRHTEILLPKEWSDKMVSKRFGLWATNGAHGIDFSHGGVVGSGGQGGIYACVVRFSINVEAAFVANTAIPAPFGSDPCGLVRSAFDDAWK